MITFSVGFMMKSSSIGFTAEIRGYYQAWDCCSGARTIKQLAPRGGTYLAQLILQNFTLHKLQPWPTREKVIVGLAKNMTCIGKHA